MRTIRLYPLPITLVRISHRPSSTSFPTSLLPLSPPHFSLFLTLILFQSHSLILATHSRVGSGTRVFLRTFIARESLFCSKHGYDFRTNGRRQRENTSPVCREVVLPASTRVAFHKIKIPLDRGGLYGEKLHRSLGTRQSNSEGAICGGIETQARGRSSEHSRIGTDKRRGIRTRGRRWLFPRLLAPRDSR